MSGQSNDAPEVEVRFTDGSSVSVHAVPDPEPPGGVPRWNVEVDHDGRTIGQIVYGGLPDGDLLNVVLLDGPAEVAPVDQTPAAGDDLPAERLSRAEREAAAEDTGGNVPEQTGPTSSAPAPGSIVLPEDESHG